MTASSESNTTSLAASASVKDASDPHCTEHPIVFFDGVCGLCNSAVDFIMARDPEGVFRFAPLQGETARELLEPEDVENVDSIVLKNDDGLFRRSSAVVRILTRMGGIWKPLGWLLWVVPKPLRDVGYILVAKTRYRFFGKRDVCRMPTQDELSRILP